MCSRNKLLARRLNSGRIDRLATPSEGVLLAGTPMHTLALPSWVSSWSPPGRGTITNLCSRDPTQLHPAPLAACLLLPWFALGQWQLPHASHANLHGNAHAFLTFSSKRHDNTPSTRCGTRSGCAQTVTKRPEQQQHRPRRVPSMTRGKSIRPMLL